MNLINNPFNLLGVSTRDSNHKILIAAEEKSLLLDETQCLNAQKLLTNPRQRLSAELAWLPGVSPGRASDVCTKINSSPRDIIQNINSFEPLSRCNIITSVIETHAKSFQKEQVTKWLLVLSEAFESIDLDTVISLINEDRSLANIARLQNYEDVERDLELRKKFYIDTSINLLKVIKNPDLALTEVLEQALEKHDDIPILFEELVDSYRLEVQRFLNQFEEKIDQLLENIKVEADNTEGRSQQLSALIQHLGVLLKQWDQIAQPIQLVSQNRGIDDDMSYALASKTRDTALYLANSYGLLDEARTITSIMSTVFQELPQFSDKIEDDLTAIDNILSDRKKSKEEDLEWKRSVYLNIEFGKIFKERLKITHEYIEYNSNTIPISAITRVRWGTFTQYTNGIKTSTSYLIHFGTNSAMYKIECSLTFETETTSRNRFSEIVDRLWRLAGVRLLLESLSTMSNGGKTYFGDKYLYTDKDGILLFRHKLFGANEPVHCRWEDISYGGSNGALRITSRNDAKVSAQLSYRGDDNTHVLESILDFLFKDGNHIKLRQGAFK